MIQATISRVKVHDQAEGGSARILLYSATGMGKTTFARDFHGPDNKSLILATDANYRCLTGKKYVCDISTWREFADAITNLDFAEFDSVAVDTVTQLTDLCQAAVCDRMNIQHPSDLDYGKAWNQIEIELGKALTKLEIRAKNVVYLAQEMSFDVKGTPNAKLTRVAPDIQRTSGRRIRYGVSLIGRIVDSDGKRVISFIPREICEGKDTQGIIEGGVYPCDGASLFSLISGGRNASRN